MPKAVHNYCLQEDECTPLLHEVKELKANQEALADPNKVIDLLKLLKSVSLTTI